jgi:NAD(P)-dependent dehydrogenase (short-subunit alcohol dehydrogenase family)
MTKTWLITGSSRGFGRSLAEAVLRAGDNLVATARDTTTVTDLVDQHPGRVLPVTLESPTPTKHARLSPPPSNGSAASTSS